MMQRSRVVILLTLGIWLGLLSGCTTWHAYEGPKRPKLELAFLRVPATPDAVDGMVSPHPHVSTVAFLPGWHRVEWTYTYPNGFRAPQALEFEAEAGTWYHLGQRFFPAPNPLGVLGETLDLAVGTALLPVTLLFPPEADEAPEGAYYAWITGGEPSQLLAGNAPDMPMAHPPITYVPLDEDLE